MGDSRHISHLGPPVSVFSCRIRLRRVAPAGEIRNTAMAATPTSTDSAAEYPASAPPPRLYNLRHPKRIPPAAMARSALLVPERKIAMHARRTTAACTRRQTFPASNNATEEEMNTIGARYAEKYR